MVIEYALARRMICDVADRVSDAAGLRVLFDRRSFDGRFHNGLYHKRNDYIGVGTMALVRGKAVGSVSLVDCLSMCKQCLHEYRHWQQTQMISGLDHDSSKYGFIAMSFGDEAFCRIMARQRLIAAEFPAYQPSNQFVLSYERDAEEYAIRAIPDVMRSVGFPGTLIEPCLVHEINRRIKWYGDSPITTSVLAAEDLHAKKVGPCEAVLPFDYEPKYCFEVSKTFLNDKKAQASYTAAIFQTGDLANGDRFLLAYIARHDPKVFCFYDIIRDEMPELSPFEKMQRKFYRTSHGLPDVNAYDSPGR